MRGQDAESTSVVVVIRRQLQSIADEVVGRLNAEEGQTVGLDVESPRYRGLVENAFVDALQRRHLSATSSDVDRAKAWLHVYLLEQHVGYAETNAGLFERSSRTVVEVRTQHGETEDLRRLERTTVDSTTVRESENEVGRSMAEEDAPSFLDRTLLPVVIIAGAMVIVYLFFTVRS